MSRRAPSLVYWGSIPSPYMVERFNAVADRAAVDFEAWFDRRRNPDRSWSVDEDAWRFRARYLPQGRLPGSYHVAPLFALARHRPDVIVMRYAELRHVLGWQMARACGTQTGFRVLAPSPIWHPRRPWREALKRHMFSRVDAAFVAGNDAAAYARSLGTPAERVFHEPQAIDVEHYSKAKHDVAMRARTRDRYELHGITFIYVGRLWWGKGVDHLVRAFHSAQQATTVPIHLLLVGDGELEPELRRLVHELGTRNVVFAGFQQPAHLPDFYAAADVFVFPTLGDPYGLVVDEALAAGLPVVSTTAAGEITTRVRDGENGFLVEPKNEQSLARRIVQLTEDAELRQRMSARIEHSRSGIGPEAWAKAMERAVFHLSRMP